MIETRAYAVQKAGSLFAPFSIQRRDPGPHDVVIDVRYCGICHSDVHQAKNEWGGGVFPMVPGHEIAGVVSKVGKDVTRFKVGDGAGVGCFVDSCRACEDCKAGEEQYCTTHTAFTYSSTEMDLKTPTYGGYSSCIVVDENYVLKVPANAPLDRVAPLLCAGITTYSPMKTFGLKAGDQVGVMGLGGLGHMAVKLGVSMGAKVSVLSSSASKEGDAKKLGAHQFVLTSDPQAMASLANHFHLIINTISAKHDISAALQLLRRDGTMILVGASPDPIPVQSFALIMRRRKLAGSLIGGIRQTQEMLDYCIAKNVYPEIEVIPAQKIDEAYKRLLKGDVRYRFVIDTKTL